MDSKWTTPHQTSKEPSMNKDQFEALGKEDKVEQLMWLTGRYRELRKLWKCSSCDKKLSVEGFWGKRWETFRLAYRFKDPTDSGWYCDACAKAREIGD